MTGEPERAPLGPWIALAVLGLVGVLAYETTLAVTGTNAWVEHTHDVLERVSNERAALSDAKTARREYGLTGDAAWLVSYRGALDAIAANGKALRSLTSDGAVQQRRLNELEPLIQKRIHTLDVVIERTKRSEGPTDLLPAEILDSWALDDRINSIFTVIGDEERRLLVLRRAEKAGTILWMQVFQLVGAVAGLGLLLLTFRRMRGETLRRFLAEREARTREEGLAKILMSIGDGVIATDVEGRLVRMNRVAEDLTGHAAANGLGKPASATFRVIDAETRAPVPDLVERALGERVSVTLDRPMLLVRRDGSELRITDNCALIRDSEGAIHGAVLVFRDVTEAERTKTLFRALVEKSGDGIVLNTAGGEFLYASPAAARMLGRTPEEILGTNILDYTYPEDTEMARGYNQSLVESTSTNLVTERRMRRPDGTCRWVELTGTNMIDDPAVGAIIRNLHDVTDRKASEGALHASEARFARLSESGLLAISIADVHGRVHEVNDAYVRLLGYSRADLLSGRVKWSAMIPAEWADPSARAALQLQRTGVMTPWENELFRADGSRVSVLLGAAMLDGENCVSFLVDLTDRRRSEKTLRETEEQLRQAQKMEAVGRLAGGVAHDFNNMLSVVLSYSDLLLVSLEASDPMRADVDEIRKAGERAAELTRQLLMFSRQQVIEPRLVDLNELLSNMERMLRRILGEDVEVTMTRNATARVLADPSGIEQALMNLVVNARDAMPKGGKLTIETADVLLDEEYARHHVGVRAGPHAMLAVTDSGTGMDAATRARIFEPFFTTKEKGKGTGLGLSTVFGIAAQCGGSVWVYSELGLGTTFKVYLPRAKEEIQAMVAPVVAPTTLRGTETILLVEDEHQVRAVAFGILTRAGYKVIEAGTAGEALLSSEQYADTIHLLLSDVVMPQMSGPELAKRLEPLRPDMRVLCMSGYTDDSIVRHGVLEAHFAFLQKPITPTNLTRKVREVLDSPRTPRTPRTVAKAAA